MILRPCVNVSAATRSSLPRDRLIDSREAHVIMDQALLCIISDGGHLGEACERPRRASSSNADPSLSTPCFAVMAGDFWTALRVAPVSGARTATKDGTSSSTT